MHEKKKIMRKACLPLLFPEGRAFPSLFPWEMCAPRQAGRQAGQAGRVRHCPSPTKVTGAPCLCTDCGGRKEGRKDGSVVCKVLQYGEEEEEEEEDEEDDRTAVG